MDLTSHSGVLLMMSGGGLRKFGLYSLVSLYEVKKEVWKTL